MTSCGVCERYEEFFDEGVPFQGTSMKSTSSTLNTNSGYLLTAEASASLEFIIANLGFEEEKPEQS